MIERYLDCDLERMAEPAISSVQQQGCAESVFAIS